VTVRKATTSKKPASLGTENLKPLIRADTLAQLQLLAKSRGVSIDEAIRLLIAEYPHCLAPKEVSLASLTPKQAQVLAHLKSGLSVKETANMMGVSEETVRTHILRARSRLDCSDLLSLRFQ
jgi:DNA-binding CsgD family transcriptional regulator